MYLKKMLILLFSFVFLSNQIIAQCTTDQLEENEWVFTHGQMESQVWTAECDGELEMVEVWPDETWGGASTFTFYLRAYDGCANLWEVPGIQVVPGEVSSINLGDGFGDSRTVVDGTQYMLAFIADTEEEPTRLKLSIDNPYDGGSYAITTENNNPWCDDFFPQWDLWFRASVDEVLDPLPVELVDFTATLVETKNEVALQWTTQSETNNLGFELERSDDARNWSTIGFVNGQGTIAAFQNYQYIDDMPFLGDNYYRLKQIDYDGAFEYSNIVQVSITAFNDLKHLSIYPNPSDGLFTVNIHNPDQQIASARLFNSTGQLIWTQRFGKSEMPRIWKKQFDLPQEEIYFFTIQIGTTVESEKIIVLDKR